MTESSLAVPDTYPFLFSYCHLVILSSCSRRLAESNLARRMQKHFQRRHQAVRPPAVDELPAAAGHCLAFERVAEQVLNGQANRLSRNTLMPAETGACALFLKALRRRPMGFRLDNQQLRHADTGQLQGPGVSASDCEMAARDARRYLRRLK